jgi:hypothetical protein
MNNLLADIMDKSTIQINKVVSEGVAKDILKTVPEYINNFVIDSIKSLFKDVQLEYLGYRQMTPKEEFEKTVISKELGVIYDLAINDVTMIELKFNYMGTPFSRYLYLPYADRGNLIKFGDTMYHIVPVLSDTVISPNHKEVFVRLLKAKISFKSIVKNFMVDGIRVHGQLVHNEMLRINPTQITDNIGKPLPATSLYLVGKFGIAGAIMKYTNATEVIVSDGDVEAYREDYHVYESTKQKPRGLKEYGYLGHDVKIMVKKGISNKAYVDNLIFGVIYCLDLLPIHAGDFVNLANTDVEQEIVYWRIMLGRIGYKNSFSVDRIIDDVNAHYELLDGYIDQLIKKKLEESGVRINDFFDLVALVLTNYNMWLINSKEYNSDINNRYIDILYYLLYDIIIGFNKVILGINRRVGKREIAFKEVIKIFNNE